MSSFAGENRSPSTQSSSSHPADDSTGEARLLRPARPSTLSVSQNIRSVAQRTDWISTENRFLLREEIIFLKEKLYHVYDDLATVFTHNQRLESNIREQKKQLLNYEQQFE